MAKAEISSVGTSTANPTPVDRPLTVDTLDEGTRSKNFLYKVLLTESAMLGSLALPSDQHIMKLIVLTGGIPVLGYTLFKSLRDEKKAERAKTDGINGTPGYHAKRYVFSGDTPLEFGENKLTKGDNFYYVQLPHLRSTTDEPLTTQQLEVASAFYRYSLHDLRDRIGVKSHEAVVLDFIDNDLASSIASQTTAVAKKGLFEGKENRIADPKKQLLAFTRDGFEYLTRDASTELSQTFQRAVNALREDPSGTQVANEISAMLDARTEGYAVDEMAIIRSLHRLFDTKIGERYNGPSRTDIRTKASLLEDVIAPTPIGHEADGAVKFIAPGEMPVVVVQRDDKEFATGMSMPLTLPRSSSTIRKSSISGRTRLIRVSSTGDFEVLQPDLFQVLSPAFISSDPTERAKARDDEIKRLIQSTNELIDSPNPVDKIALLADRLIAMFDILSFEELTVIQEDTSSYDTLVELLRANNLIVERGRPSLENERSNIIPKKHTRKVGPLVTTLAAGLAATAGIAGIQLATTEASSPPPPPADFSFDHIDQASKPDISAPTEHQLLWRIESKGLDVGGFYITTTSHTFQDGAWQIAQDNPTEITIPAEIHESSRYISLERNVVLNPSGNTSFKLPIKAGTYVGALTITSPDGINIPYRAIQYSDNTIQIDIDNSGLNGMPSVVVKEILLLSTSPDQNVHAVQPATRIDITKLSDEAREFFMHDESMNIVNYFNTIRGGPYSVNPEYNEILNQSDGTPEGFLNAAVKLRELGMDCDVANSFFIFLSQSFDNTHINQLLQSGGFINMAGGTMANYYGDQSLSMLDAFNGHGAGISNTGRVIDATPLRINSNTDQVTQDYLRGQNMDSNQIDNLWKEQGDQSDAAYQAWKKIVEEQQAREQKQEQFYTLLGYLGMAGAGYLTYRGGREAVKLTKRYVTKENMNAIKEKMVMRVFSQAAMEDAYGFFNAICFGPPDMDTLPTRRDRGTRDKREMLELLTFNVASDKIKDYLKHPKQYEQRFGIDSDTGRKYRLLARYLQSHTYRSIHFDR